MRKERDGETTKQVVVDAARQAFAEQGFAGTSLADVSKRCGISAGLILHHFKSKENLYQIVLEGLSKEYFETIRQAAGQFGENAQDLEEILRAVFEYWSSDTLYNKISTWAYLENRSEIIDGEVQLTVGLAHVIQKMQSEGQFDDRFSSIALMTMTIGPILFWVQHHELFREALHIDQSSNELNALFLDQYIQLIRKLYMPVPDDSQ